MAVEYGEWRALAHQRPCHSTFVALCELADAPEAEWDQQVIDYVERTLARWPKAVERPLPRRWLDDLVRGVARPTLSWCSRMHMHPHPVDVARARELGRCTLLRHITSLAVPYLLEDLAAFEVLAHSRLCDKLDDLELHGNLLGPDLGRVLASAAMRDLRSLSVEGTELGHEGVRALLDAPWLHLDDLDIRENAVGPLGM